MNATVDFSTTKNLLQLLNLIKQIEYIEKGLMLQQTVNERGTLDCLTKLETCMGCRSMIKISR